MSDTAATAGYDTRGVAAQQNPPAAAGQPNRAAAAGHRGRTVPPQRGNVFRNIIADIRGTNANHD